MILETSWRLRIPRQTWFIASREEVSDAAIRASVVLRMTLAALGC